jgi:hypothetical protein
MAVDPRMNRYCRITGQYVSIIPLNGAEPKHLIYRDYNFSPDSAQRDIQELAVEKDRILVPELERD